MDVYEELGRLAQRWEEQACSEGVGWAGESRFISIEEGSGASNAFDAAQQLVEFLRWRDPAKEWPADSCRCLIVAEFPGGGVDVDRSQCMEHSRAQAVRWRYILGPCSCGTDGK